MKRDLPETLDRDEDLELPGPHVDVWARRAGVVALAVLLSLALANVFGQRASTTTAAGPSATLDLRTPGALRSGLVYQARFRIQAKRPIAVPQLVLGPGWFDGLTLNTVQPEPVESTQHAGQTVFTYDPVPAGGELTVRLQYQVNPTTIGARTQTVSLADGGEQLVGLERSVTIFP